MQDFSPSLYSPLVLLMENVFLGIFIFLCFLILYLYKNKRSYLITAFPLGALSAHQVEEYILSPMLLGEKYHFLEWAYRSGVYISPMEVATVNTIPYLLTPLLFLFNPSKKIFAILFLLTSSTLLSNGMFHIGVASAQTDYSPGLLTSLFMYIPLYIKALLLASEKAIPMKMLIALTIYGSIAHFLMLWLINIF
jgi:hypothetical protein